MEVKSELQRRNPAIVPQRDIEKLQVVVDQRQGTIDAATASKQSATLRISTLLPAEKASAEAAMAEAQVNLDKLSSEPVWQNELPDQNCMGRAPAVRGAL